MRFFGLLKLVLRPLAARENEGVAAVEFALCATVFLTILAGTVDIGLLLYTTSKLDAAVSAGAQYAENNASLVSSNPTGLSQRYFERRRRRQWLGDQHGQRQQQ